MQYEHKIVKQIDELNEFYIQKMINSNDFETILKFKKQAKAKAEQLLNSGQNIYDLDYFLEYVFLPSWEN
jgi:hypothetical protein